MCWREAAPKLLADPRLQGLEEASTACLSGPPLQLRRWRVGVGFLGSIIHGHSPPQTHKAQEKRAVGIAH